MYYEIIKRMVVMKIN